MEDEEGSVRAAPEEQKNTALIIVVVVIVIIVVVSLLVLYTFLKSEKSEPVIEDKPELSANEDHEAKSLNTGSFKIDESFSRLEFNEKVE